MCEAMGLGSDGEVGRGECALDGLDELMVWDRCPRCSSLGCVHRGHLIQIHGMGAAVEDEVGIPAMRLSRGSVEELDHDKAPLSFG